MHRVQIVMANRDYAAQLELLLVRDGCHRVEYPAHPDFAQVGVVVLDVESFRKLGDLLTNPDRIVLISGREESSLRRAWEAGLRSVVFTDEPVHTTLLAVMAAELRLHAPVDELSP